MATCVCVLDSLYTRLAEKGGGYSGALYGLEIGGEKIVVAAGGTQDGKATLELMNEMLPCGIEPIGVFGSGDLEPVVELSKQLPTSPSQPNTNTPVILLNTNSSLTAYLYVQGEPVETKLRQMSEEDLNNKTVTIRVRGKLDLTCGLTQMELSIGFKHLIEKVSCPYGTFIMEGNQILFLHKFVEKGPGVGWTHSGSGKGEDDLDDEDCTVVGLEDGGSGGVVEDLWQYTVAEEEDDGWGGEGGGKKKKSGKVERRDRLEFSILWNLTNPACTTRTIGCAPIIHYEQKSAKTVSIPLNIDALGLVDKQMPVKDLMEVLKGSVARQISDIAAAVLSENTLKKTVSLPEVFHYKPDSLPHYITLVYPRNVDESAFETFRRAIHQSFLLPTDRPLLKKSNSISFHTPGSKEKLRNVHQTIRDKHGVPGALVSLVQGTYTYYHYMQDNFDDDGWGCAYRSLQTIFSWFRHQGFTATTIPSHRDIQKCLVDIGDKEAKFIGSKQWIGSTEVGFVLETACDIQSRFISVATGADLPSKARELVAHFQTCGTPVMIGGGVYAHTILGIAWDEATGACSWLVLDPHYTGSDDIKTILAKGWCGWKGPKFWNQTAFYNMCLPIPPSNCI